METVSELVQEAIDYIEKGLFEQAFLPACKAFEATARKVSADVNFKKIVDENWWLISFMSFPNAASLYLKIPIIIKEISPNPRTYSLKEIVTFVLTYTLRSGKLPTIIKPSANTNFEKQGGKLLIPNSLTFGLLGFAIFNPVNKNEIISDKYWLNVSSFKMFVSEFFGRIDLAERIVKFYRDKS